MADDHKVDATDQGPTDVATELALLSQLIATLPAPWTAALFRRAAALSDAILRLIATVVERDKRIRALVDQATVDMKYIDFDLQATRRERDQLQRRIDDGLL